MVRSNADILDVVGNFVQMRHAGKNWVGLCPFHAEKTPSFSINEQKQFFYCFSCGRGGNVFKFIMELEDLNFIEAVYRVAELENIEIDPRYSPENQARFQKGFESSEIGGIFLGGGVPKHYTMASTLLKGGLDAAIQITMDRPETGSLSGAPLEEAKSWSKAKCGSNLANVVGDATIIFPLIFAAALDKIQ